ncbi:MAG: PH domain-containing protein [Polyangiaceae bacterium]
MVDIRAIERPHPKLLWLYLMRSIALLCLGPWFVIVALPFYFKYKTLRYRFDDEGVAMSWGLIWRREIYLTYARVQDIHLSRGLFERWLGLATIQVQTAAGSAGAEMSIEGLEEFEAVRDFLYQRMRGAKHDVPQGDHLSGDVGAVLLEIRDEVRALREGLAEAKQ